MPEKDADRSYVPADFDAEVQEVLTAKYYSHFSAAIKAKKEDFEKELPSEVAPEIIEKLLKFVSVKETDHIIGKYETKIKEITSKIDELRKERGETKKKPAKKSPRSPKNEKKKEVPLEEQLHSILAEVKKRTNSVQFSKDDYSTYSEAQS